MDFPSSRLPAFAAIALCLLSAAPGRSASLIWEKVKGPEGGDFRTLSAFGDTVIASNVQGDFFRSTDAGGTWNQWRRNPAQKLGYHFWGMDPVRIGDRLMCGSTAGGLLVFQGAPATAMRSSHIDLLGSVPVALTRIGDTLLLAASGVFLSVDSGSTWSRRGNSPEGFFPLSIAQAGGVLLAVIGPYRPVSFHESRDKGASWTELTITLPSNLYVSGMLETGEGVIAWSSEGTSLRLRRNGSSWRATAGKLPGIADHALYSRPGGIWCLSSSGVHLSRDAGATWVEQATAPPKPAQTLAVLPGGDILVGTSDGIFAWDRLARSWSSRNSGLGGVPIHRLVKRGTEWVAAGENSLHVSRDQGATWKNIASPSGLSLIWKLSPVDPDLLVHTPTQVYPLLPGDSLGSDIREEFPFTLVNIVRSGNQWLASGAGAVRPMFSLDNRKTWQPLGHPRWIAYQTNLVARGARMAAADEDSIVYSIDSGLTWKSAAAPDPALLLPGLFSTDSTWFFSGKAPYRSADPAQGWSPVSFIPNTPGFKGMLGTDADLHAVTDSGYFRSADGGVTWERRMTGLAGSEYVNLRANATTWHTEALDGGFWAATLEAASPVRLPPSRPRSPGDPLLSGRGPVRVLSADASGGHLRLHLQLTRPSQVRIQALSAKGALLAHPVELDLEAGSHLHLLPVPAGSTLWRLEAGTGRKKSTLILRPRGG